MEVEKKSGRGKKEVSLIGLFGKQFLEEMQNKLAEATGVSFCSPSFSKNCFRSFSLSPNSLSFNAFSSHRIGPPTIAPMYWLFTIIGIAICTSPFGQVKINC